MRLAAAPVYTVVAGRRYLVEHPGVAGQETWYEVLFDGTEAAPWGRRLPGATAARGSSLPAPVARSKDPDDRAAWFRPTRGRALARFRQQAHTA